MLSLDIGSILEIIERGPGQAVSDNTDMRDTAFEIGTQIYADMIGKNNIVLNEGSQLTEDGTAVNTILRRLATIHGISSVLPARFLEGEETEANPIQDISLRDAFTLIGLFYSPQITLRDTNGQYCVNGLSDILVQDSAVKVFTTKVIDTHNQLITELSNRLQIISNGYPHEHPLRLGFDEVLKNIAHDSRTGEANINTSLYLVNHNGLDPGLRTQRREVIKTRCRSIVHQMDQFDYYFSLTRPTLDRETSALRYWTVDIDGAMNIEPNLASILTLTNSIIERCDGGFNVLLNGHDITQEHNWRDELETANDIINSTGLSYVETMIVIRELLDNSLRACMTDKQNGVDGCHQINLDITSNGHEVNISVSNDATQIPPNDVNLVTGHTFTVDRERSDTTNSSFLQPKGAGLGLTIASTLCRKVFGILNVPQPDGPTIFTARIPIKMAA